MTARTAPVGSRRAVAERAPGGGQAEGAQAERGGDPERAPGRGRRAPWRAGRPRLSRVTRTRSRGASATSTVSPPCPSARTAVAIAQGRPITSERPAGCGVPASRAAIPSPSSRWAPRNTLKKGTATARAAARARWPRPSPSSVPRERDQGRPGPGPGRGRSGSPRPARASRLPRKQVRPPVGLRIRREERTRSRWPEQRPRDEGDGRRRRAEAARRSPRSSENEGKRAQGDVEARDRVEGVDAGPAQRGRAHEVGPEVVAEREAGDARDLRRVAEHQLARQPHVEGGVVGDERVEQEVAVGRPSVPADTGSRRGAPRGPGRAGRPRAGTDRSRGRAAARRAEQASRRATQWPPERASG